MKFQQKIDEQIQKETVEQFLNSVTLQQKKEFEDFLVDVFQEELNKELTKNSQKTLF